MQIKSITYQELESAAAAEGLRVLRSTGLAPLEGAVKALIDWQQAGYSGEMAYMQRPASHFGDLARLLPSAKSIVSFAVPYSAAQHPVCPPGYGKVARYAWGLDYHTELPQRMQCLIKRIQAKLGWFEAGVFSDAVSILERAVAARGGLGFVGKNTLLIRPGQGSFFLLGEIVWELDICDQPETPAYAGCRSCTRCLNACPTNAFVDERVLDARKCIAYLSIEKRGMLSLWERRALGNWIFGCDVCQEVCPFNHAVQKEGREPDLVNLGALKGAGKILNLSAVLRIRTQEVWRTSFAHTALERARRAGLLRNAACVAVNTGAVALIPDLVNAFKEDSAPAVRATSFWALSEFYNLGALSHSAWCSIVQAAKSDVSSEVQKEYALLEAIS